MNWCLGPRHQNPTPSDNLITHDIARGHWRLIGLGAQGNVSRDPITVAPQIMMGIGTRIFQAGRSQFWRQVVLTAFGAILQEPLAAKSDHRRNFKIVDKAAVADNSR